MLSLYSGGESQSDHPHLWSSFAHAAVMAVLGLRIAGEQREDLIAATVLVAIGVILIELALAKAAGREGVGGARVSERSVCRCSWREQQSRSADSSNNGLSSLAASVAPLRTQVFLI